MSRLARPMATCFFLLAVSAAHAGLLAEFSFDETSGNAIDVSGHGVTGVLYGVQPTRVASMAGHGKALSFAGPSVHAGVLLGRENQWDGVQQGTIEAWLKLDPKATYYQMWFDVRDSGGCAWIQELSFRPPGIDPYVAGPASLGAWSSVYPNASCVPPSFEATSPPILNPGDWHHVAYVVGASSVAFYLDAQLQTLTYLRGSSADHYFLDDAGRSSHTIYDLGGADIDSEEWQGLIDDVRIWDTPRSGVQIYEDMHTPVSSLPRCSDGIDNDGDGQIDYPSDIGCTSASDDSEMQAGCGLGFELALVTPLLARLRLRRRRPAAMPLK